MMSKKIEPKSDPLIFRAHEVFGEMYGVFSSWTPSVQVVVSVLNTTHSHHHTHAIFYFFY